MNMLRYSFLHLRRNIKSALITLVSFLAVLMVILFIQQSVYSRQKTLESMAASSEIRGDIADTFGNQTDFLKMDPKYPMLFMENESIVELVEEVSDQTVFGCSIDGNNKKLVAITGERADQTLYYDGSIFYNEGYDASIWLTGEKVCVISPEMEMCCYEGEDSGTYLDVIGVVFNPALGKNVEVPITMQVIGEAVSQNKVFCPYLMLKDVCDQRPDVPFWADALAFTVRDNTRLDELRAELDPYFGDSDIQYRCFWLPCANPPHSIGFQVLQHSSH